MAAAPPSLAAIETLGSASSCDELAAMLGVSPRKMRFLLYRLAAKRQYRSFDIKKRGGGVRKIRAPILPIKLLQSRIAALLELQYAPRSCVFGYVKGRNIQQNAERHVGKRWVLRIDLKDFFPSVHFGRVYGLLKAGPFSLGSAVAATVAKICTHDNQLPQGSPASPILTNILCRGLDHELGKLARTHRCTYSRYCDDIVFSTNRMLFPSGIALPGDDGKTVVGGSLSEILEKAGFRVNPAKVKLRYKSQRQMVTGLIVNERLNVPLKFVRELRMMLHVWQKFGEEKAAVWYDDKRNRPPRKPGPSFRSILRGRLQYLGSVRGWHDKSYLTLATKLQALDPTFKPTRKRHRLFVTGRARVYVEGATDKPHIEMALGALQRKGQFSGLGLTLDDKEQGSTNLLDFCTKLSKREQQFPHIFLFDSDEPSIVDKVRDPGAFYKDWGNGVYSLVLPTPPHRSTMKGICIEHLYQDGDLYRRDQYGRRLFAIDEFHPQSGRHTAESAIYRTNPKKSTLIVDDDVWSTADPTHKVCVSKVSFTKLIADAAQQVDFAGFVPLFEHLVRLMEIVQV